MLLQNSRPQFGQEEGSTRKHFLLLQFLYMNISIARKELQGDPNIQQLNEIWGWGERCLQANIDGWASGSTYGMKICRCQQSSRESPWQSEASHLDCGASKTSAGCWKTLLYTLFHRGASPSKLEIRLVGLTMVDNSLKLLSARRSRQKKVHNVLSSLRHGVAYKLQTEITWTMPYSQNMKIS